MPLHRTVIVLGVVSLFNDISSDMVWPLLPIFLTQTLQAGPTFLGLVEGIAETMASLINLYAGALSDRFRRRKPLAVGGYLLSTLIRGFMALVTTAWHVVAIRFVDRIGKGFRSAPRDALIAEVTPAEKRGLAFGFHRAMDHVGALIGPVLAFVLIQWGHQDLRGVFLWAIFPGIVAVLVVSLGVHEEVREKTREARTMPSGLPQGRSFRCYLGLVVLFTLANSSDSFILLKASQLGLGVAFVPLLSALLHVVKALASTPGGWLSDRWGRRPLVILGWALYAVLYGLVGLTSSLVSLWIIVALYGIYYGLTEGVQKAWVADMVESNLRGAAFGWYHMAVGLAVLPANVLFGTVWEIWGSGAAFLLSAFLAAAAALGLRLFVKADPPRSVGD